MGQLTEATPEFSCAHRGMVGPLSIDYIHIFNCELKGFEVFSILVLIFWTFVLIDLLAKVESGYFTPTLASISIKWHLSDNFAGVTLLAFANGAPDVFCSVIGLMSTGNTDLGISALLGGALFVSTVVVGCIAIFCPCKLNGILFTRDATFLIIAVVRLAILGPNKEVTLLSAVSLLIIYVVYLLFVLMTPWIENRYSFDRNAMTELRPNIQTALWNHDEENGEADRGGDSAHAISNTSQGISLPSEHNAGGYKFIILDEYVAVNDLDDNASVGLSNTTQDRGTTINLSGSLLSKSFTGKIIEEFHRATELCDTAAVNPMNTLEVKKSLVAEKNHCMSTDVATLKESLLSELSDEEIILLNQTDSVKPSRISDLPTKYATILALSVRHRFMKRNARNWANYSWPGRILLIIEYPVKITMDLTIATLDEELWDKKNAVLQPLIVPFFLTSMSIGYQYIFTVPYAVFHFTLCVPVSLLIYFRTHSSYPPRHKVFSYCWLSFGFLSCVMWTYLLSGELVTVLLSTGSILRIPSYYLGLTVLAWGNSIGDLFSNISIAKSGMGEMAIGGCYAGPIFNILTGMGISLTYMCYRSYPHPSEFLLNTSSSVSIGFLLVAMVGTVLYTALHRFHLNAVTGYALITLYTLYTVIQTFIVVDKLE